MQAEIQTSASLPILQRDIFVVYKKYQTLVCQICHSRLGLPLKFIWHRNGPLYGLTFFLQHSSLIAHRNSPQSNPHFTQATFLCWPRLSFFVLCVFSLTFSPVSYSEFPSRLTNTASFILQGKLEVISEYGWMRYEENTRVLRLT